MDLRQLVLALADELRKSEAVPARRLVTQQAVDLLHERASHLWAGMSDRRQLSDGRQGYRVRAQAQFELIVGAQGKEGPQHEIIEMETSEAQVFIADPVLTLQGTMRVDLEILSFTLQGTSNDLFGKVVPIRMHCGRLADKYLRQTFGRIEVPHGVEFGQVPVRVVHEVFVTVETPLGVLHNRQPALMMGFITKLPPINQVYEQIGHVDLFNEQGERAAVKATQRSHIVGLAV